MAIRVVARIRPRNDSELNQDVIVTAATAVPSTEGNHSLNATSPPTLVKIPSPKNENETFAFQFSGVYDESATQQAIFDHEGSLRSN
jgi:hypothetical protein